jgi:hypothetical protein
VGKRRRNTNNEYSGMKGSLGRRGKEVVERGRRYLYEWETEGRGGKRGEGEGGGYKMPLSNLYKRGTRGTGGGRTRHASTEANRLGEPSPNRPKYTARPITPPLHSISLTVCPQYQSFKTGSVLAGKPPKSVQMITPLVNPTKYGRTLRC